MTTRHQRPALNPACSAGFVVPTLLIVYDIKEHQSKVHHQKGPARQCGLCGVESGTKWLSWSTARMPAPANPGKVGGIPVGHEKTENTNEIKYLWRRGWETQPVY